MYRLDRCTRFRKFFGRGIDMLLEFGGGGVGRGRLQLLPPREMLGGELGDAWFVFSNFGRE
jgi:hypothetical protein